MDKFISDILDQYTISEVYILTRAISNNFTQIWDSKGVLLSEDYGNSKELYQKLLTVLNENVSAVICSDFMSKVRIMQGDNYGVIIDKYLKYYIGERTYAKS